MTALVYYWGCLEVLPTNSVPMFGVWGLQELGSWYILLCKQVGSDVVKIKDLEERDEVENKICCLLWPNLAWVAVSSNVWARTF
jgi:hypothetical protein